MALTLNKIMLNDILLFEVLEKIQEAVYLVDSSGKLVYINNAAEKLEQVERNKLVGKHIEEIYKYIKFHSRKNSPCLEVLKSQLPRLNENLEWFTPAGSIVNAIVNTYPVFHQDKLIGAIQIAEKVDNIRNRLRNFDIRYKKSYTLNKKAINNGTVYIFDDIIGRSEAMQKAISTAKKYATQTLPVLIYGETGTGKELFAQSIHNASPFVKGPFVPINCAAIPETLLESILFGTVKGAYTGAIDKSGLFEQANNGTIFLDEINSMPLSLQAKLLRALQEKEIQRIGSNKRIPINCRVLSAINKEPNKAIADGELREDLFYRLSTGIILIPPLRERGDDLELLISYFIQKCNYELNVNISSVDSGLLKLFHNYKWPGNVRELANMIESSMSMVGELDDKLTIEHLSLYSIRRLYNDRAYNVDNFVLKKNKSLEPSLNMPPVNCGKLNEMLYRYEKNILTQALKATGGNLTHCGKRLGISRQNLTHKIKKFNIDINRFKTQEN